MTMANDFDHVVARWLETDGPYDVPPGLVEAATAKARQARQRRGVALRLAGPSPWPTEHRRPAWMRRTLLVVAAVLVVLALAGTVVLVGALLSPPTAVPLGRFMPGPTMLTPRFQPQASLLLDGSILVVGASTADEVVSAERYDATSGIFEPVGSMDVGVARGRVATIVRLTDGRVLVIGSTGGQADGRWPYTEFARIYDPASRSFTRTTPFPDDAVDADGYVVHSGGYVGTLLGDGRVRFERRDPASPVITFDPASASYAVASPLVLPRLDGNVLPVRLVDGRILMVGMALDVRPYAAVYDPRTATTTPVDVPGLVSGTPTEAATLPDGRVLLVGNAGIFFDPRSDSFKVDGVPALSSFVLRLRDGRWLFTSPEALAMGAIPRDRLSFYDPRTDTFSSSDESVPEGCCWEWVERADGSLLGLAGMIGNADGTMSATWLVR